MKVGKIKNVSLNTDWDNLANGMLINIQFGELCKI